jgi:hypothetical protein
VLEPEPAGATRPGPSRETRRKETAGKLQGRGGEERDLYVCFQAGFGEYVDGLSVQRLICVQRMTGCETTWRIVMNWEVPYLAKTGRIFFGRFPLIMISRHPTSRPKRSRPAGDFEPFIDSDYIGQLHIEFLDKDK